MGTGWAHRAPGGRWWLAALVVPVVLAGMVVAGDGDDLERDLTERVWAALVDQGVTGARVSVDGRDVTVSALPAGSNVGALEHTVADVDGVRTVEVQDPGPLGAGSCPGAQRRIDRILGRDKVHFAPGSARLVGEERREVVRVGRLLRRCAASVTVRGNVVDPQEEAVNPLSQERAGRVADVLRKHGGVVDVALGGGEPQPIGRGPRNHYVSIVVS